MKKLIKGALVLMSGFSLTALAAEEECALDITKESMVVSGYYQFYLPSWWDDVEVLLPQHANRMTKKEKLFRMREAFPIEDMNDSSYWREEIKYRVLADTESSANFIGHGFYLGQDYCTAAYSYISLYYSIGMRKDAGQSEDIAFSKIYLPYRIAMSHSKLGNDQLVAKWKKIGQENWLGLSDEEKGDSTSYYFEELENIAIPNSSASNSSDVAP